jgi:oligoendopeptidase F
MFAEFERDIHQVVEQGGSLTSETLNDMYGKLVAKYFGPDVIVDDEIKFEWSRIPHFYYNFYVFQYATGLSAATTFAKRVINQEDGALEKYKGFLKAGRSQYPMDVLKQAGLDMTDPAPIIEALETFSKLVDEFDELI